MYEILRGVQPGEWVLDLGCQAGSFPQAVTAGRVVRIDREFAGAMQGERAVACDAARLPFHGRTFSAVICNHSLEHIDLLPEALMEIGRVVTPGGALYVAVPDVTTVTDKLYRWISRGGGHVNGFDSAPRLALRIEEATGLPHRGTKDLFSSLSFLNRNHAPRPTPRRLMLLGGGREWTLFLYVALSRWLDRRLGTRLGHYGWALYFGGVPERLTLDACPNVCVRCGAGHAAHFLRQRGLVRRTFARRQVYDCPGCGAVNPLVSI
ncbi:MAG: methyltransferase domain-containing protein [Bryobacterales bacterium]|nr:methyltransferase domain-containing protein [Bryobacterales bacterium]